MARVGETISDGRVLKLIDGFLKQEIMSDMARWQPTTGTPQGAVLSPLLANIYLHPLDLLMEQNGRRMVRYADDFVILCRTEDEAEAALREIGAWTAANGLTLHPDKTRVADSRQPGQGFEFLGYRFEAGHRFVRKKSLKALKDKVRPKRSAAGVTAWRGLSRTSTRRYGDGLAISNTPRRLCFETSIVSFGDGCAPFCASRTSGPASDDAKPITCDGPTPSSKHKDCSPSTQPSNN